MPTKIARTDLASTTEYDAIVSHPKGARYVAVFMHQTGLLGRFRHEGVGSMRSESIEWIIIPFCTGQSEASFPLHKMSCFLGIWRLQTLSSASDRTKRLHSHDATSDALSG